MEGEANHLQYHMATLNRDYSCRFWFLTIAQCCTLAYSLAYGLTEVHRIRFITFGPSRQVDDEVNRNKRDSNKSHSRIDEVRILYKHTDSIMNELFTCVR